MTGCKVEESQACLTLSVGCASTVEADVHWSEWRMGRGISILLVDADTSLQKRQ